MKVIEILRISRKIMEVLQESCINISDVRYVDLYADYRKSLEDKRHIAYYIQETLCDPDGNPTDVLSCFAAKMQNAGIAIHWERYL